MQRVRCAAAQAGSGLPLWPASPRITQRLCPARARSDASSVVQNSRCALRAEAGSASALCATGCPGRVRARRLGPPTLTPSAPAHAGRPCAGDCLCAGRAHTGSNIMGLAGLSSESIALSSRGIATSRDLAGSANLVSARSSGPAKARGRDAVPEARCEFPWTGTRRRGLARRRTICRQWSVYCVTAVRFVHACPLRHRAQAPGKVTTSSQSADVSR